MLEIQKKKKKIYKKIINLLLNLKNSNKLVKVTYFYMELVLNEINKLLKKSSFKINVRSSFFLFNKCHYMTVPTSLLEMREFIEHFFLVFLFLFKKKIILNFHLCVQSRQIHK